MHRDAVGISPAKDGRRSVALLHRFAASHAMPQPIHRTVMASSGRGNGFAPSRLQSATILFPEYLIAQNTIVGTPFEDKFL
jgi:hypothetical protein